MSLGFKWASFGMISSVSSVCLQNSYMSNVCLHFGFGNYFWSALISTIAGILKEGQSDGLRHSSVHLMQQFIPEDLYLFSAFSPSVVCVRWPPSMPKQTTTPFREPCWSLCAADKHFSACLPAILEGREQFESLAHTPARLSVSSPPGWQSWICNHPRSQSRWWLYFRSFCRLIGFDHSSFSGKFAST